MRFPGAPAPLFDGLDLELDRGRVVGLVGPNGCGKTTLLACLAGIVRLEAGEVTVCGHRLDPRDEKPRSHIGYVPDDHPIHLKLTVSEYLDLCAALRGSSARDSARRRKDAEGRWDITDFRRVFLSACSHGMTKRVALAAAQMAEPDLLLLDEPEAGLDPTAIEKLGDWILERRRRGSSVLVATHRLDWLPAVADVVWTLNAGRLTPRSLPGGERESEVLRPAAGPFRRADGDGADGDGADGDGAHGDGAGRDGAGRAGGGVDG